MSSPRASMLVRAPVLVRGIRLGEVEAVLLDPEAPRILGLDVRCGDGSNRFLPYTTARVRGDAIEIDSTLLLLDEQELAFYRSRGRALTAVPELADALIAPDGGLEVPSLPAARVGASMQRSSALRASDVLARARVALGRPQNWLQLARFCAVGASGFVVNLVVYALLLRGAGLHYLLAASGSFLVAVTSNYTWNRLWTFRRQRGHVGYQGLRFLVVSTCALGANLVVLYVLVEARRRQAARPGRRDRARHPAELRGKQALVLRALAAFAVALALAAPGAAAHCPHRAGLRRGRPARRGAVRPSRRCGTADREAGDRDPPALPEGRRLARPLPAQADRPTPSTGRRPTSGS